MKAGTNTRLFIASGQMRNCKVYHCPCVSVSFPKKRYQNMTLVYSFSEETSPLSSALLKFVVPTALAPPPPPTLSPPPTLQNASMDVSTDHARILNNPTSQIPVDPVKLGEGLASLVMVACWTIHNIIGFIWFSSILEKLWSTLRPTVCWL